MREGLRLLKEDPLAVSVARNQLHEFVRRSDRVIADLARDDVAAVDVSFIAENLKAWALLSLRAIEPAKDALAMNAGSGVPS